MTVFFPNVDPIYLYRRKKDEYLELVDTNNVQKQEITLKEIPLFSAGVTAKDSNGNELIEVKIENSEWYETFPLEYNEFRIDYSTGVAYFNRQRDGEEITLEYIGTGYVNIPSQRIVMPRGEGEPIQTLQDALNKVSDAINILGEVGEMKFSSHYSDDTQYYKWNFVSYKNATYVALTDVSGEKPDESDKWQLVSSGVAFADIYSPNKTYRIGDMVSDPSSKNLYMSRIDNNMSPLSDSDSWSKMISLDDTVEVVSNAIKNLETLEQQLIDADLQRDENEESRDARVDEAISDLEHTASTIVDNEQERQSNEIERVASENIRKDSEAIREQSERERVSNEKLRQSAEIGREQQFNQFLIDREATVNDSVLQIDDKLNELNDLEIDLTNLANRLEVTEESTTSKLVSLDNFRYMKEEYNPDVQYYKYNIVTKDGNTYIALKDNIGVPVDDSDTWGLIAKSENNQMQISIEGATPDENGEITLDDIDIVRKSTFEQRNEELDLTIGDLSSLKTLNKNSIVDAINELKNKIDDIISAM